MAADNISSIIDPSVMPELQALVDKLVLVEGEITAINGKNLNIRIEGIESINALTDAIQKQQISIDGTTKAISDNRQATAQLAQVNEQLGVSTGTTIQQLANQKIELQYVRDQMRQVSNAIHDGSGNADQLNQRFVQLVQREIQLKNEAKELTGALNQQSESVTFLGVSADGVEKIFGRMILRMAAYQLILAPVIAGVTALISKFTELSAAQKIAEERTKAYTDEVKKMKTALNDVAADSDKNYDKEFAKAERWLKIITNQKSSVDAKKDAYDKLNDIMPQVLKNYSLEQVEAGKATKEITKQIDAYSELKGKIDALQPVFEAQSSVYNQDVQKRERRRKNTPNAPEDLVLNAKIDKEGGAMNNTKQQIESYQAQLENITAPVPKEKKDKKPKSDYELKREEIEAEYNLRKRQLEQSRDLLKEGVDDESKSLKERYQLNLEYQASLIALAGNEYGKDYKLNNLKVKYGKEYKKTGDQNNAAALQKYYNDYQKIVFNGEKQLDEMRDKSNEKWVKSEEEAEAQVLLNQAQSSIIEEQILREKIDKNLVTAQEGEKQMKALLLKRKELEIETSINFDKMLLGSGKITDDERKQLLDKIRKLEEELQKLKEKEHPKEETPSGAFPMLEEGVKQMQEVDGESADGALIRQLNALSSFSQQAIDIYSTLYASIKQIRDNEFAAEQQQILIQQKQLQLNSQQQIAAIDATTGFAIEKDNEKAKAEAQNAAAAQILQNQSNQLQLKQAIADKQAAEAGVILSTALAIAKTLPLLATNVALGIAEIAIISGLGAAQYAAAASTPLPQFEKGGTTTTDTFIAGEKGHELMISPSGNVGLSSANAKIHKAPIGTKIIPADETEKLMKYAAANVGKDGGYNAMQALYNNHVIMQEVAKIIGDKYMEGADRLETAIYRTAPQSKRDTSVADAIRESNYLKNQA